MKDKESALKLLSYMIEVSKDKDAARRKEEPDFVGEGWMTFNLNRLKELINDDA